ncbi:MULTISPECIES: AAA family ATPase [Bacteroidota]|uniref:ATP-binding protein n=1 Tax=Mucilaginibacter rubeus TaxID=2027860 RepID=A0AAE6JB92_9SPHI|nr:MULTISPECIES: AAA family ATPase [Bacteroidota]QEM02296.1 ATP-binding protein [Mucilaginibacter rubeus]QEM14922.1 ATP-binding protein [Mucilaginibacter gossypii]QTE42363.1 ATP-binding protein [Mucilaginibacter rubeus]QTE48964.1 ATP-binding protein [Mucilaginibacter rubeus]QTE54062.1 ATP-binding protein [Mucilaginibacter rubeus]
MYTEIIKIIEGGLKKEPAKVIQYAKKLMEKLTEEGNLQLAKGIKNILENKGTTTLAMEQLITSAPVDSETRMSIVDIFNPATVKLDIVLPETIDRNVADFIKIINNKDKIKSHGLPLQCTLLLYGIPGVGKTTIAKYVAAQTGLPLVTARLDALISSLLGNTSKNIRKVFEFADSKPCILFLDEFDAIAKARDDQHEMGELKRVINSLLQNIDEFSQNNVLIAATNHPELLDKAIWRRFNSVIEVTQPSVENISKIISLYAGEFGKDLIIDKKKTDKLVQLLSQKTPSDIRTIINNALTHAIVQERTALTLEDLLIEIFQFEKHGSYTTDELVKYLNDNGIPQMQIAELLSVSIRQIRNNLKD